MARTAAPLYDIISDIFQLKKTKQHKHTTKSDIHKSILSFTAYSKQFNEKDSLQNSTQKYSQYRADFWNSIDTAFDKEEWSANSRRQFVVYDGALLKMMYFFSNVMFVSKYAIVFYTL